MKWTCTIHGQPVAKGRPRAYVRGGRARMHTPEKTQRWEAYAALVMYDRWERDPLDGPVAVTIRAIAHRPGRLKRKKDPDGLIWRTTKPDADNVAKAALDAMEKAGIVADDRQVVDLRVLSLYAERTGPARVTVELATVEGEP